MHLLRPHRNGGILLGIMADNTASIALINMVGTLVGVMLTGLLTWIMARQKARDERAALLVANVKKTLEESDARTTTALTRIKDDTGKTLTHVNDQFLIQLRLYAESTRTIAALTGKQADKQTADAAQALYLEHKVKQEAAAASVIAVQKEQTGIAREQLAVQKQIEANTDPDAKLLTPL